METPVHPLVPTLPLVRLYLSYAVISSEILYFASYAVLMYIYMEISSELRWNTVVYFQH